MAAELHVISEKITADKNQHKDFPKELPEDFPRVLLQTAFTRYAPALKGYLMRTVSLHDAEDLMQEVFLRMAKHNGLGQINNLQAFMFTTATNLLRDRWRRRNAKYAPTMVCCDDVRLEAGATDRR